MPLYFPQRLLKTLDFDFALKQSLLAASWIWYLGPGWIWIWKSFTGEAGVENVLCFNSWSFEFFIFPLNSACILASSFLSYLFLVSALLEADKSNQLMISLFCHKVSSNSTSSLDTFPIFQIIIVEPDVYLYIIQVATILVFYIHFFAALSSSKADVP